MTAKKVLAPLAAWAIGILIGVALDNYAIGIVLAITFTAALRRRGQAQIG